MWSLCLSFNKVSSFPMNICNSKIKFLQIGGNGLKSIPDEIGKMKELQLLWITMNSLKSLPAGLRQCTNLNTIQAYENSLKTFDFDILKNKTLQHVFINKNSFNDKMKQKLRLRCINNPTLELV